jgi:lipopolysaccharide/colanic/teichoic acid biosynthesis glycosyltransferase
MIFIAFAIKLTMPGPVFFKQERIGINGNPFILYKFRSMVVRNSQHCTEFDAGDDSRVTSLGSFLRRTKLDELPQFINVLIGNMSIVGPRPEVKKWTLVYPEKWEIVHKVKPGITDYASIIFRNEEQILKQAINPISTYEQEILPHKLNMNIVYVKKNNMIEDFKIIISTIISVLRK